VARGSKLLNVGPAGEPSVHRESAITRAPGARLIRTSRAQRTGSRGI